MHLKELTKEKLIQQNGNIFRMLHNISFSYSIVINERSHASSVPAEPTPTTSNIKVGASSSVISKSTPKSSRKHHLLRAHRAVIHRQPWKDVDINNKEYDIYLTEASKEEEKTDTDLPSFVLDAESKMAHTRIPQDAELVFVYFIILMNILANTNTHPSLALDRK